jgi:hypothetical protein
LLLPPGCWKHIDAYLTSVWAMQGVASTSVRVALGEMQARLSLESGAALIALTELLGGQVQTAEQCCYAQPVALTHTRTLPHALSSFCCAAQARWGEFQQYRPRRRPRAGLLEEDALVPSSRAWWRYAIRGVVQEVRKQRALSGGEAERRRQQSRRLAVEMAQLVMARLRYIPLYKRATAHKGKELAAELAAMKGSATGEEMAELQSIEDSLQLSHVLFFRAVAHAELAVEKRCTKALLKSYKREKEAELGGSVRRLGRKMSLSTEEYQAAKPIKPSWQIINREQVWLRRPRHPANNPVLS